MDLKSNHNSPVLTDTGSLSTSRIGICSAMLPYSTNTTAFSPTLHLTISSKKSVKLDDFWSSFFDAMKSSSPTHNKLTRDASTSETTFNDIDFAYYYWMLKYPSALSSFEQIAHRAEGKRIVLFLDYDGTLSPIVNNPDHAYMTIAMRAAVRNANKYFPTAIISGRSLDKVYEFVKLTELYYAGSHGMDIMGPVQPVNRSYRSHTGSATKQGEETNLFQPASEFLPMIKKVFKSLVDITKDIAGATVENNKFCVSVHYRNVDENSWAIVGQCVDEILKEYPQLRVTHGRKVLEVRPILDWNKGKAVEYLLESLGFMNSNDVLPIYIGDDRTDEDAFKVLREANRGCGIIVSSKPKESKASYSLRDPSEVMEFLKTLVKWKRNKLTCEDI